MDGDVKHYALHHPPDPPAPWSIVMISGRRRIGLGAEGCRASRRFLADIIFSTRSLSIILSSARRERLVVRMVDRIKGHACKKFKKCCVLKIFMNKVCDDIACSLSFLFMLHKTFSHPIRRFSVTFVSLNICWVLIGSRLGILVGSLVGLKQE